MQSTKINLDLPSDRKTVAIQEWIEVVLQMVDGYRSDHVILMANINRLLLLPAEAEDIVATTSCHIWICTTMSKIELVQ